MNMRVFTVNRCPCKRDCAARSATCHANCESYTAYLKEKAKKKAEIEAATLGDRVYNDYKQEQIRRRRK